MKKLSFLLLIVTAINLSVKAQMPVKSPDMRAAHMTKVLSKTLNLTADQESKINAILLTRVIEMDSLKSTAPVNKKSSHLNKKKIDLTADEQIMGLLNNDQQKRYAQWEADQKEKKMDKKGMIQPDPAPATKPVQG